MMRRRQRLGGPSSRFQLGALRQRQGGAAGGTAAKFQAVNASGSFSTYAAPPTFAPDVTPEFFTLTRQGFDGLGAATTLSENLICTKRARQAYPNQATLTTDQVALSDYVYSTDTVLGAVNNSTRVSPKPIANWARPDDHAVVGNTLPKEACEVVAFHRNARAREQVAAVKWVISDGTNSITAVASQSVVSAHPGDKFPVIVYRPAADIDISTLTNGPITLNAEVYPHVGTAASVAKSVDSAIAREFSPRVYLKNPTLAAAPVYVYVNASTGNDTTGAVSTTAATAEAAPCLTIGGAINRAIAVNAALDGVVIRLMAGTHAFTTAAIIATRAQTTGELIITRDPNATRATAIMTFGAAAPRPRFGAAGGWLRLRDITVTRTGALAINGEATSPLRVTFDQCIYDNAAAAGTLYSSAHGIWLGTPISNATSQFMGAAAGGEHRMWRGLTVTMANLSMEGWLVLGCDTFGVDGLTQTNGANRSATGQIAAYSAFYGVGPSSGALAIATVAGAIAGAAFVQNIVEYISATANAAMKISADSAAGSTSHVVIHNNTFAGFHTNGRANNFYDEGATPRTNDLQSCRGNIWVQLNTKGDVFVASGARVGNWDYLYGVGCRDEFSQFTDASSGGLGSAFAQAYPGLGASIGVSATVRNDPLFLSPAATTSGPVAGAGRGNYALQAGSPCKAKVANPVLRFDLAGTTRSATAASQGAFE